MAGSIDLKKSVNEDMKYWDFDLKKSVNEDMKYWNSLCELHRVVSPENPFPCLGRDDIECCPMNSVLHARTDIKKNMQAQAYTHAAWVVYKDAHLAAIPMCSLVSFKKAPSEEVISRMFGDRYIKHYPAKFGCNPDCACHTHLQKKRNQRQAATNY